MKQRKLTRRLMLVALAGSVIAGMVPAHAGATAVVGDSANDVIDYTKHIQNSFRPESSLPWVSPWSSYNHCNDSTPTLSTAKCAVFDIKNSQLTTNATAQTITMTMLINSAAVPLTGETVDKIPAPFQNGVYEFNFATSSQEKRQVVGFNCSSDPYTPDPNYNTDDLTTGDIGPVGSTGAKVKYDGIPAPTAGVDCPVAADESKGTARTTAPLTRHVQSITNITTPPHPAADGWLGVVVLEFGAVANGVDKGDGSGTNVVCQGGAATCIDWDMQVGGYEGYGQGALEQDKRDFDPASQAKMPFSIVHNAVGDPAGTTRLTATVPWNPTVIAPDGDGLVDDAQSYPWPFATSSQVNKITNFVAETTASISAGVNTVPQVSAVCTGDSDNIVPESADPIHGAGQTLGDENKAIYNQTKPVDQTVWDNTKGSDPDNDPTTDPENGVKHALFDDPSQSGEQGQSVTALAQDAWYSFGLGTKQGDYSKADGFWLIGTGGHDQGDCIRGLYGLLTVLDWTDNGFQIRLYPRSPSYAPSQTSLSCRYPMGRTPTLVNAQLPEQGPAPSLTIDDSPYDSPSHVTAYVNGAATGGTQTVPAAPNVHQVVDPAAGLLGRDQECKYTNVYPGLHYFDILGDFTM